MQHDNNGLEAVYRTGSPRDCRTHELVLKAAGIDYEVYRAEGAWILVVASNDAPRARREIETYAKENAEDSPTLQAHAAHGSGWPGVIGYALTLLLIAVFRYRGFLDFDWFAAGKTHAGLIRDGQWWRTITALTLHADLKHLFGNLVFGGLFGLFAGQMFGSGLAWLTILIGGAAGNLLNAWIREPGHTSIGASTAVFATLGLVAAASWVQRARWRESRMVRFAPIVGAVVLLSYLGTGGVRTDVLAHVTGFLAGLGLGALYGKLGDRIRFQARGQMLIGTTALVVLAGAWSLALASHAGVR